MRSVRSHSPRFALPAAVAAATTERSSMIPQPASPVETWDFKRIRRLNRDDLLASLRDSLVAAAKSATDPAFTAANAWQPLLSVALLLESTRPECLKDDFKPPFDSATASAALHRAYERPAPPLIHLLDTFAENKWDLSGFRLACRLVPQPLLIPELLLACAESPDLHPYLDVLRDEYEVKLSSFKLLAVAHSVDDDDDEQFAAMVPYVEQWVTDLLPDNLTPKERSTWSKTLWTSERAHKLVPQQLVKRPARSRCSVCSAEPLCLDLACNKLHHQPTSIDNMRDERDSRVLGEG